MPRPLLSIIIPTFNERDNINPLIERLMALNSSDDIEVLVVDSALTSDGTLDSIHSNAVRKIKSTFNSRAKQLHQGAQLASADMLYFVHADTRPTARYFSLIFDAVRSGCDFGFFSFRFDSDSKLLMVNTRFTQRNGIFTGGGDQSFFIRKSTYEAHNGYDCSLPIMEDFEFFWRLKDAGLAYTIIPEYTLISARKYERNSYLKVQLVNLVTLLGFKWGRDPLKLKAFYVRMLG